MCCYIKAVYVYLTKYGIQGKLLEMTKFIEKIIPEAMTYLSKFDLSKSSNTTLLYMAKLFLVKIVK